MKTYKYYGTCVSFKPNDNFIKKYGEYRQYRIVCKAHSMAEANRIAEGYGIYRAFNRNYTSITRNDVEIKMCDKYGFIINTSGMTYVGKYVDIKEAIKEENKL